MIAQSATPLTGCVRHPWREQPVLYSAHGEGLGTACWVCGRATPAGEGGRIEDKPVVSEDRTALQRALVHQWESDGYLLSFIGLLLGVGIGFNRLPIAIGVCLVLLAQQAVTSLALLGRRFGLALYGNMIGAVMQSMLVFGLYGLLVGHGAFENLQSALIVLTVYPLLVYPLVCSARATWGCFQALDEGWESLGPRRLPGWGGSPPDLLPGAVGEQPARMDHTPRAWSIRFAFE